MRNAFIWHQTDTNTHKYIWLLTVPHSPTVHTNFISKCCYSLGFCTHQTMHKLKIPSFDQQPPRPREHLNAYFVYKTLSTQLKSTVPVKQLQISTILNATG
jgi:hypothetical protein